MEIQKFLKSDKITIVADYRERDVIESLKNFNCKILEENLEVGDFICSERLGIERKSSEDFINSILDSRIFEQSNKLKENFEIPVIIIEGNSIERITENAFFGCIATIISKFRVSIFRSKDFEETAKIVFWLAKKEQEDGRNIGIKIGRKPKDDKRIKEKVIASLPGISSILSKRLLEHFGNLEKIFKASELELIKVKGINKKLAKKIRKIICEKY